MSAGTGTETKVHEQLNRFASLVCGVQAIIEQHAKQVEEFRQAPVLVDTLDDIKMEFWELDETLRQVNLPASEIVARLTQDSATPRGRQLAGTF